MTITRDLTANPQPTGRLSTFAWTELAYLAAVRESYDTVAADYAARGATPAELAPLSRAMLAAFAEIVETSDRGPVADLGCGQAR